MIVSIKGCFFSNIIDSIYTLLNFKKYLYPGILQINHNIYVPSELNLKH